MEQWNGGIMDNIDQNPLPHPPESGIPILRHSDIPIEAKPLSFKDCRGETTLQLILPLILLLSVLVAFAVVIPSLSPLKTLVLAGGLVVFVLTFVSTEIALYILIFSMLLSPEFVVGATEGASLGRGVTLRLDDFLIVIIGLSWLARMAINKDLGLFLRTPLNKPIAFYLTLCLVSTLLGAVFERVHLITGFFYVLKYFQYVIVYFMAANHLKDKKQVQNFVWAMLLTCAVVSVVGMVQVPSGERVSAPFEGRVGEPNTFGGYLVFMICICAGIYLAAASFRHQLVCAFLILLFSVPLFYTQSRSSYLAAIPAVASFIWLSKKRFWVLPFILLIAFSLPYIAPRPAVERVSYTFTQGRDRTDVVTIAGVKLDTSTSARIRSWKEAVKDLSNHPILGYGVTGYKFVDAQYVRVAAETGLLGLFSFLFLMAVIFREGARVHTTAMDPFHKGLATGFLAGFIGLLFHSLGANTFIIVRIMEPFWFIAAMVMVIPSLERTGAADAARA
jgi:O-antigen ligase